MQLSTVLALFAAVAAVSAAPSPQAEDSSSSSQGPSCNNGKVQCCSQLQNPKESSKTLASLGLEGIAGLVGADCDQVPVIAGAVQNTCKSTVSNIRSS